jgi:hypothetical protein
MRRRPIVGIVLALSLVCGLLCGVKWGRPVLLTLLHGRELENALQHYWDVYNSPQAFEDPSLLAKVMTGDLLTNTAKTYSSRDEPPRYIPCRVTMRAVQEHTSECSRVLAQVVCGSGWGAFSGNSGQYIFLREEGQWKVVNFWQDIDTHNTLWPSSTPPVCKDFLKE